MSTFHYTACGLDNVYIEGLSEVVDHAGNSTITIAGINQLHKVICEGIVCHSNSMNGDELRFLRSEMGMTQAELAGFLHCAPLTVGRWERGEGEIGGSNEALIRMLAIEKLSLNVEKTVDEISASSVPSAQNQSIDVRYSSNQYSLNGNCAA